MSESDSDDAKDGVGDVKRILRDCGMSYDVTLPQKEKAEHGPENMPDFKADDEDQEMERRMGEAMKYFAKAQRKVAQELGAGTLAPPERILHDGTPNLDYFSNRALQDHCLGRGEGKATIAVASRLKDEQAAKAFADGDYQSADTSYRIALWLLAEDDSEYTHARDDPGIFEECPGAPHSCRVDRFKELPEDSVAPSSAQPAQEETEMSEEDLERMREAEKVARDRYTSDLPLSEQAAKMRQTICLNLAAVALKRGQFTQAKLACEKVMRGEMTQAQQEKVQYRYVQACEGEGSYGRALKAATKLINMKPNVQEFRDLYARVKKKKEKVDQTYKKMSEVPCGKKKVNEELYTEQDQRKERAKATLRDAGKRYMEEFKVPAYCDGEWMAKASKEDRQNIMEEIFKEKMEDRLKRFEDLGLTPEMGEHVESLYRQGYRTDQLEEMMDCMRHEANEELKSAMNPQERSEVEALGSALYKARDAWAGATDDEEKKKAHSLLVERHEAYKAKVREVRAVSKQRLNDELKRLMGKIQPKKNESSEKEAAEKEAAEKEAAPAECKAVEDKTEATDQPKSVQPQAKRPDASCCAGARQCQLM